MVESGGAIDVTGVRESRVKVGCVGSRPAKIGCMRRAGHRAPAGPIMIPLAWGMSNS